MLQLDWSMVRLRPHSVSSGCTETQFDLTPQSPQPSQTRSLMIDALVGIGERAALATPALLGRAGLVVDQHRHARHLRELALHGVELVAVMDGQAASASRCRFGYFHGSSVTTTTRLTPSAATCRAICGTVRPPSFGCPPVIATASLNSIL